MNKQRGALTFITPIIMVVIIMLGALAMDGARLYSLRQEMQSQVNAAVTAAADAAQACGGHNVSMSNIRQRALAAASAQGFGGGADELDVDTGILDDFDDDGVLTFREADFLDQTNAVLVRYERSVPISVLLPESVFGKVSMNVNAVARKQAVASLTAGGNTAGIGGGLLGGLLGRILGQPGYTLNPTSLSSLENTTVQLGELLNALDVNTIASALPLGGDELAVALGGLSSVAEPLAKSLDQLAASRGVETIQVGDIIRVVGETEVPANSEFPLYDLVISLVLNIAKSQQVGSDGLLDVPLNISNFSISPLFNIKDVSLSLHVGEAPSVAIGPARKGADGEWLTRFYAPDISLQLVADAEILSLPLLLLDFSLADLRIPLALNVGGGFGDLVSAQCASGLNNEVIFGVHLQREVARLVTGTISSSGMEQKERIQATVGKLRLLGIPLVDGLAYVDAEAEGILPGMEDTVFLDDPSYSLHCSEDGCDEVTYQDQGGGISGLNTGVTINELTLLKTSAGGVNLRPLVQPIVDLVEDLLDAVISTLGQVVIDPLLQTLGVGLGGISVTINGANQDDTQLLENVAVESAGN